MQAKKGPSLRERTNRAALGDIGNKNPSKVVIKQDLKKSGSSLPVAAVKSKQSAPKIEIMDLEEESDAMNKTVEMMSEIAIPDGVSNIDEQDSENPQVRNIYP